MIWDLGDGIHIGRLGVVLPDRRLGVGHEPDYVCVEGVTGQHLRDPVRTGFELVPEDLTVGWQPHCECGWRGEACNRIGSTHEILGANRSVKALIGSPAIPPLHLEQTAMEQWRRHVLSWNVEMAAQSLGRAAVRLDQAVTEARTAGLTWADIGRNTGMTRQAAHQRWSSN